MLNSTGRGRLLLWMFVISGFSGLIYQSIWTQYLGLFLGHSSHAQSLVLMLFMGGMALGAWLVSRRSERLRRPLLAYASIELVIGLAGLLFDPIYRHLTHWAYEVGFPIATNLGMTTGLRWSLATVMVLPQCILLGATFPLMSAGFMRLQPASEGRVLSSLYFANSIGAAIGALAATYLLLPAIGLPGAMLTAGLLNVMVAVLVYPLGKLDGSQYALKSTRQENVEVGKIGLVLIVAALTGLTSFVYEIVWVRMLSLAVGSTLHTFELMLAAFIAGIAFGGLWLRSRADRLASPLLAAGWVQILMGLAALGSLFVYLNSFEWVGWLLKTLTQTSEGYLAFNVASGLIAMVVMFPAAFFAGMTLPLLTLALLRSGAGERAVGWVYAVNTLGAILGVLLAVHLLMPWLGVKFALWSAAAVDLLLGLFLLTAARGAPSHSQSRRLVLACIFCIGVLVAGSLVRFDPLVLASSVFRNGRTTLTDAKMLYYRDGKTATVAVYESTGDAVSRSIATNGKVDAGVTMAPGKAPSPDEYTMALLASLPLSMRPSFDRVGVIGFGSGMSTHTLLGSDKVGRVDTVEIEPYMIEGARNFESRVQRAFHDPRSHIVVDDAKSYFAASNARYDLIVSEPSNPWMGGTASLFTEEFYSFVPRHLKPNGLFVQWVQLYEIDPALVSSILRAMLGHFEDVQAYGGGSGDLILIASPRGRVPPLEGYAFQQPALASELKRLGYMRVRDLQDGFLTGRRGLEVFAAINPAPVNSDFFPYLQLNAPATRFKHERVTDFADIQLAPWPIAGLLGAPPPRRLSDPLAAIARLDDFAKKLHVARELHSMLTSEHPTTQLLASGEDALQADTLRAWGASCQLDLVPERSVGMILSLAKETVPFLDPEANAQLWVAPSWLKCTPKDGRILDALAFAAAAARNDPAQVLRAGQELLDGPAGEIITTNIAASHYVWGAIQTALVASEQPKLAAEWQRLYGSRLPPQVVENNVIRFVSAMAMVPPNERLIGKPSDN